MRKSQVALSFCHAFAVYVRCADVKVKNLRTTFIRPVSLDSWKGTRRMGDKT